VNLEIIFPSLPGQPNPILMVKHLQVTMKIADCAATVYRKEGFSGLQMHGIDPV
jgi:hypothetical protein